MRAALYARYSSDRQRVTSIEDQFRNCERFVAQQGWKIVTRYRDDAISGTRADRPGYRALLADAEAGAFEVIVIDDLSRLSRDDTEAKLALRRLVFIGVRVVATSDGLDTASKGYKLHASLRATMNEAYLDDLRERVHRGQAGQALRGFNAGGRSYGYRHVPIEDPVRKDEYGRPSSPPSAKSTPSKPASLAGFTRSSPPDARPGRSRTR